MKKALSLLTAWALCLSLAACGGGQAEDAGTELAEGMVWVTQTQELYPLDPGCIVTGTARLDDTLLIAGESNESAPLLALAGYTVGDDGSVRIGDAVPFSLDEPDAVDEGHLYGVCAGGDGFFYVLTGELPAGYTDNDGAWVENEDYAGRYSILRYSPGGELVGRMKLTGWHGASAAGIAVGADGEIVVYGDSYLSLLRWDGDVIHTEKLGEERMVQGVSLCGQGLVASLFEFGTAQGSFYRIDGAIGSLSPLTAVCADNETALYGGSWPVTQGLDGEYIAAGLGRFYAVDFADESCRELFLWDTAQSGQECTCVCRLAENTFVYTLPDSERLFLVSRAAQEAKDRSVVRVAVFHSYAGSQYQAKLEALNAAGGDYIYECTLYEKGQLARLQADLSSSNAPDLVLFDCFSGLDTNSEYFEDLYPYLDSDPELSRNSFLPNLLEALSFRGRLTQLWEYVQINTMAARTCDVGDGKGLTPADYAGILARKGDYRSLFLAVYNGEDQQILLSNVATLALSIYADRDHASCSFDSSSFAQLLQWVKDAGGQFLAYDSSLSYPENFRQVVANPDILIPFRAHYIADSLFGEPVTFAGYPVGNVGGHLYAPDGNELAMAIPAYGSNKEGAWAYIRDQLSFETQYSTQMALFEQSPALPRIPVNDQAMKRLVSAMLSPAEAKQVIDLTRETKFAQTYTDEPLYEIIVSVSQAYLAGDKSLEGAVSEIQSRASMYMAEKYS